MTVMEYANVKMMQPVTRKMDAVNANLDTEESIVKWFVNTDFSAHIVLRCAPAKEMNPVITSLVNVSALQELKERDASKIAQRVDLVLNAKKNANANRISSATL